MCSKGVIHREEHPYGLHTQDTTSFSKPRAHGKQKESFAAAILVYFRSSPFYLSYLPYPARTSVGVLPTQGLASCCASAAKQSSRTKSTIPSTSIPCRATPDPRILACILFEARRAAHRQLQPYSAIREWRVPKPMYRDYKTTPTSALSRWLLLQQSN